jgi:hypothetical protein
MPKEKVTKKVTKRVTKRVTKKAAPTPLTKPSYFKNKPKPVTKPVTSSMVIADNETIESCALLLKKMPIAKLSIRPEVESLNAYKKFLDENMFIEESDDDEDEFDYEGFLFI